MRRPGCGALQFRLTGAALAGTLLRPALPITMPSRSGQIEGFDMLTLFWRLVLWSVGLEQAAGSDGQQDASSKDLEVVLHSI